MSIALACLVVMSASLVSGILEQRRERALRENRDRNAREALQVHLTVDHSQSSQSLD